MFFRRGLMGLKSNINRWGKKDSNWLGVNIGHIIWSAAAAHQ